MSRIFTPWTRWQNVSNKYKDFEIFEKDGRFYFYIDYIGRYSHSTLEEAQANVVYQKRRIKLLLQEIEQRNQRYYEARNKKMEDMQKMLHEARQKKEAITLTNKQRKKLANKIYEMIADCKSDDEILEVMPFLNAGQLARFRVCYDSKKK